MSLETLGKSRTEQLRGWATNKVRDVLGYSEKTVVTAAIACLGMNYDNVSKSYRDYIIMILLF